MANKLLKKKALILLDSDIVVRAFVDSHTFDDLSKDFDLSFCFAKDFSRNIGAINTNLLDHGIPNPIPCDIPRKRMGYWYFLFAAHALYVNRKTKNYKLIKKYKFQLEMGVRNTTIVSVFATPVIYQCFRFLYRILMGTSKPLENLIVKLKPDVIIYPTLLTGWFLNDVLQIAQKNTVPLVLCMNSWDNPSSKAVCTALPTKLIVWGQQSKEESIRYLGIPGDRIECFGAAQFQIYRKHPTQSHHKLCCEFGVPNNKRIILYAGTGESLNETQYLKKIDEAISRGLLKNCHVLYRPHPWRGKLQKGEENFFTLNWSNVSMDPNMIAFYEEVIQKPTKKFFNTDYQITNRLLKLVSGTISARSTLLLESIVNGKPILVLFPTELESDFFSSEFIHFKKFISEELINTCTNIEDIEKILLQFQDQMHVPDIGSKLKKIAEHYVISTGDTYSKRLLSLANDLVKNNTG